MIYEPREDSFLLAKYVRKYAKGRVLDMGTGSGVLALAALEKTKNVEACDIDKEAVKLAKSKGVKAYVSDLFFNVKGKFDLIIFNPPYLPLVREYCGIKLDVNYANDKAIVGGKKGHETILRFFKNAKKYLKKKGKILMIVSSLTPDIEKILRKYKYKFRILEKKRIFFEELKIYLCDR